MPSFGDILAYVCIKKKEPKMSGEFKPTTIVKHRYEEVDVLEKCLEEFGFKPKQWKISDKNRPGIQIQLPDGKKLTEEQVKQVHAAYEKEHKNKLRQNNNDDEED